MKRALLCLTFCLVAAMAAFVSTACANQTRLTVREPATVNDAIGELDYVINVFGVAIKSEEVNAGQLVWLAQLHDPKLRYVERRMNFSSVREISLPEESTMGWGVRVVTTIATYNFYFDRSDPKAAARFRAALAKLVREAGGIPAFPDA